MAGLGASTAVLAVSVVAGLLLHLRIL